VNESPNTPTVNVTGVFAAALELLLLGGHYRAPSNSVVGPFATEALRRTHATKAFIGVEGISVGSGLTTPVAAEAEIARRGEEDALQARVGVRVALDLQLRVADHVEQDQRAHLLVGAGLDQALRVLPRAVGVVRPGPFPAHGLLAVEGCQVRHYARQVLV
jgi:hypothetical protein